MPEKLIYSVIPNIGLEIGHKCEMIRFSRYSDKVREKKRSSSIRKWIKVSHKGVIGSKTGKLDYRHYSGH